MTFLQWLLQQARNTWLLGQQINTHTLETLMAAGIDVAAEERKVRAERAARQADTMDTNA